MATTNASRKPITLVSIIVAALAAFGLALSPQVTDLLDSVLGEDATAAEVHSPISVDYDQARSLVSTLQVNDTPHADGYDQDAFTYWSDTDGNGCDARNDILARDLTEVVTREDDCTVQTGTLADPFTGNTIDFERGPSTSGAVQIDHVVSRSDAWKHGAWAWSDDQREIFANDPANLLAVDGPSNGSKSDKSADQWLPTNPNAACLVAGIQVTVKDTYDLSVTSAEQKALAQALADC